MRLLLFGFVPSERFYDGGMGCEESASLCVYCDCPLWNRYNQSSPNSKQVRGDSKINGGSATKGVKYIINLTVTAGWITHPHKPNPPLPSAVTQYKDDDECTLSAAAATNNNNWTTAFSHSSFRAFELLLSGICHTIIINHHHHHHQHEDSQ